MEITSEEYAKQLHEIYGRQMVQLTDDLARMRATNLKLLSDLEVAKQNISSLEDRVRNLEQGPGGG